MLNTARMELVPATLPLARAEIADRDVFSRILGAQVPDNWPPETLADALPLFLQWFEANPQRVGWFGWYGLIRGEEEGGKPILAASAGFKGPPKNGSVEVGYSVLPQFQRQGLATEMVGALISWSLQQPDVSRILAETTQDNQSSLRVLQKLGFRQIGPGLEPGDICFELRSSHRSGT